MNTPYKQLICILSETGKVWNSYDKNRMLWEKSREDRQAVQRRQGSAWVRQPLDCQGKILTRGGCSVWDGIEENIGKLRHRVNCLPHRKQQQRKSTSEKSKRAEQTENREKQSNSTAWIPISFQLVFAPWEVPLPLTIPPELSIKFPSWFKRAQAGFH